METTERPDRAAAPNAPADTTDDECYRCGYALRGIADEQPCPECGLVALRSRRPSDALHDTRPPWLRRIALGAGLILAALLSAPAWPFLMAAMEDDLFGFGGSPTGMRVRQTAWLYGGELSALLFLGGILLLTSREGYEPDDLADRGLRRCLRVAAAAPLAALLVAHADAELTLIAGQRFGGGWSPAVLLAFVLATAGSAPLPWLLFRHLRGLAARARSAHLAEHCTIVGAGASATLVYFLFMVIVLQNAEELGFGDNWLLKSPVATGLLLAAGVAAWLFPLWGLYLLVRFAVAFRVAARRRRRKWRSNDRDLSIGV